MTISEKFKPYPKYKDSGVEWIEEIPEKWNTIKLGFLGHFSKGGGISRANLTDFGCPAILYGDIYTKYNIQATVIVNHIAEETISSATAITKGQLLLTGSGETVEDIGKTIVYFGDLTAYVGGDVIIYTQDAQDSKFLSYSLNSPLAQYQKSKEAKGEIIVHIYSSSLKNVVILLPPIQEQTQIAQFLDHETCRIEKLIEKKNRQIELLKGKRSALITHAVTKGLNPDAKMKDSGVEWIGEIPEGWGVKKLKHLANIQTGNTPPKSDLDNYCEDGIPWIKPDDLGNLFPLKTSKEKLSDKGASLARIIPENSVLVCCIGTIGKIGVAGCKLATNQQINSVIFKNSKVTSKYGQYLLTSAEQEHIKKSNKNVVAILNSDSQKNIEIPYPPLDVQLEIVSFLDKETFKIDALISKIQLSIDKLKEFRTALISAAVTGKIDVRNWKEEAAS